MNKKQYYLIKLAEEAAELSQIAIKCAQFGEYEVHPHTLERNIDGLQKEYNDVVACVLMVEELLQDFTTDVYDDTLEAKFEKMEKYRAISKANGMSYE